MTKKNLLKMAVVFQCIIGSTELLCKPLSQQEFDALTGLDQLYLQVRMSNVFVIQGNNMIPITEATLVPNNTDPVDYHALFTPIIDEHKLYIYFDFPGYKRLYEDHSGTQQLQYPVTLHLQTERGDNINIQFSQFYQTFLIANKYNWLSTNAYDAKQNMIDLNLYGTQNPAPPHEQLVDAIPSLAVQDHSVGHSVGNLASSQSSDHTDASIQTDTASLADSTSGATVQEQSSSGSAAPVDITFNPGVVAQHS